MTVVRLNRIEAGADYFHDLVVALGHQGRECGTHPFLIIRNKYTHPAFCRMFYAIRGNRLNYFRRYFSRYLSRRRVWRLVRSILRPSM